MTEKNEFLYLYDLSKYNLPDFLSENEEVILLHWEFLQHLKSTGYLLFAGITLDSMYEFVVIQAKDRDMATRLFVNDPYLELNLVNGNIYSFRASLFAETDQGNELLSDDFNLAYFYTDTDPLFMGTITARPTFVNDMTEEERRIMAIHFEYLKKKLEEKKLILAGPILEEGMFGITIFYADNLDEARNFIQNDPAVKNKIVESNVHPFRLLIHGRRD